MGIISIPVRLTLAESCAVALHLAAEELAAAADHMTFLAALDSNHRLWLSLAQIETLIAINREVAGHLAGGQDMEAMHSRAALAWQERGRPYGLGLERWLIAEMERKARIRH